MVLGPLACAAGVAGLSRIDASPRYLLDVLPPVVVLGLGLSLLVAPLTSTVLAAAPARHAGVASGINNAVARAAGLLAVAALPVLVGITGDAYGDPALLQPGFRDAMLVCAGLLVGGSVLAALGVPSRRPPEPPRRVHCAVTDPPLQPTS
jgi:hypothetical protein